MPEEVISTTTAMIAAAGSFVGVKLFGGVLTTIGDDLNKAYQKGRDKILESATKKVSNPDDGKIPNLRASRDILWNGAITDDEVCAEYFGGMLASARSTDGKDDAVIHYVDVVKALSAKQLELHYVIYSAWQKSLVSEAIDINLAQSSEVTGRSIYFSRLELEARGLQCDQNLTILHRQGLVSEFKYDKHEAGDRVKLFVMTKPTMFGIMLFAVAHNRLSEWLRYNKEIYHPVSGIEGPKFYSVSIDGLEGADVKF